LVASVVLVVDDDEAVRKSTAEILGEVGYSVIEAADATTALEQLRANPVDAMVLDIRMPDHDGFWLLDQLDDAPPVIVVTAHRYEREIMEKRDEVSHYLQKPVQPSELLWAVAKVVAA